MTQTEALRLALEALESTGENNGYHGVTQYFDETMVDQAITAIKAALEAKDEPVAWVYPEFWQHLENLNCGTAYRLTGIGRQPLYTTPPQRKPCGLECDCTDVCKQDDYKALWQQMCERCDELDKKLAQCKPLTDEEIWACLPKEEDEMAFARAIEAKLKQKNFKE